NEIAGNDMLAALSEVISEKIWNELSGVGVIIDESTDITTTKLNQLDIKWRLDQFSNNNKINYSLLTIDNTDLKNLLNEKLIPGFALRSKQKFRKRGGKKLDLKVVEKLKEMFLADNIEKSNKFSPEDMLKIF
ncbi:3785_t:CDS:2, partial [Entrophospora sp. SA101]